MNGHLIINQTCYYQLSFLLWIEGSYFTTILWTHLPLKSTIINWKISNN